MNKSNITSWEALDKAWQKQIQEQSDEVPAGLWDQIDARLNEKPARPMWTRLSLSPWTWSAAAVLAVVIGMNWESGKPSTVSVVANVENPKAVKQAITITPAQEGQDVAQEIQRKRIIQNHVRENNAPTLEQEVKPEVPIAPIAKVEEKLEQAESIWVRIDINPIEENAMPTVVAQQEAPVITKKKSFIGRLLKQVKQVAAGEQLDWQQLKEGNQPLEDGIHQVANTYYRTEQTIKQTFQIQ